MQGSDEHQQGSGMYSIYSINYILPFELASGVKWSLSINNHS